MAKEKGKEKGKEKVSGSNMGGAVKMRDESNLVEFDGLKTWFYTDAGVVRAVDGVSFDVPRGKTVGIVGESGCGKSVTSLSLMRLLQEPIGRIVDGQIRYQRGGGSGGSGGGDGGGASGASGAIDLAAMPKEEVRRLCGKEFAMVFQEPMTSLNPVFTIGRQIDETLRIHSPGMLKRDARARTKEMLELVGMARADGICKSYPHELSGGMRQRVMIAMALACEPRLIIADEPTTALDVTIQAQILDLMRSLKERINASIMLITHDLGVIAEMADYVVVMYAGRVIERGTAEDIYHDPQHPYTVGLLGSKPVIGKDSERLHSIPGNVPNPINMPDFCYFRERCGRRFSRCAGEYPPSTKLSRTHDVCCYASAEDAWRKPAGVKPSAQGMEES